MMGLLRGLALSGGDWVIWLLLASSVLALAVIVERGVALGREWRALEELSRRVGPKLGGEPRTVALEAERLEGLAARVLAAGARSAVQGATAAEEQMAAASLLERRSAEGRLLVLGTLGNNAPFVGLFGTVLGVMKAFHDLSLSGSDGGPEAVMLGLSEALLATAVGLFVAIPCVVAYNYYQKRVRDLLTGSESLNRRLLAMLKSEKRA